MHLNDIVPVRTRQNRKMNQGGYLTIVNSEKNGKRLEVLMPLTEMLGIETEIKIGFYGTSIVISSASNSLKWPIFSLKTVGKKKVIYSASLVNEVTERLGLDFSLNDGQQKRVSYTLPFCEVKNTNSVEIALISNTEIMAEEIEEDDNGN